MRCAKTICLNVGFMWSRFVQKILKRIDLLLNRLCTTVTMKTTRIFAPKLVKTSRFSNLMVKNIWSCAGGLKKPQWPLSVCCLGLVATKGVLALKSMHKGLGSSQTSHILVCDFLGSPTHFLHGKHLETPFTRGHSYLLGFPFEVHHH